MSDELVAWSRAIADAWQSTGLRPEQVLEACMGFSGAPCPDCGNELNTSWAWCEECAEWKAV